MTDINTLIEKIKGLPDNIDDNYGGVFVYDYNGSQSDRLMVADLKALVTQFEARGQALRQYAIGVDPMSFHGELMRCELCASKWNNGKKRNVLATPENHKPDCLLAAQSSPWVAVSDGLPADRGFYWVTRADGRVQKQGFDLMNRPECNNGFDVDDVIAWMPNPKPEHPFIPSDGTGKKEIRVNTERRVLGFWKGDDLYWNLGGTEISDADFKQWLRPRFETHNYPYDGIIRQMHTDLWFAEHTAPQPAPLTPPVKEEDKR